MDTTLYGMKDLIYLLLHLLTTLAKMIKPGGGRAVMAENLLLRQQLIIHSRSRQRAPNLTTHDRVVLGFWTRFMNPRRIARSAIIIKPATLLRFHAAMKKRKYRNLYSPGRSRKPGPKGPSKEIKSLPHVPMSHPFVERLIGSMRRELLDHTFFWTATDLGNKLRDYQTYYNKHRTHAGRNGVPPVATTSGNVIDINQYRWGKHCRGLFELPVAA